MKWRNGRHVRADRLGTGLLHLSVGRQRANVGSSNRNAAAIGNSRCDRDHSLLHALGQYVSLKPSVLQVRYIMVGGSAMWDFDSYREFLSEHASNHHLVGSSLLVLVVVGTLLIVFS